MSFGPQQPSLQKFCIGIDAMGSDYGPEEVVAGIHRALQAVAPRIQKITLLGDETIVRPLVDRYGLSTSPLIGLQHTSEVVHMDENPLQALKHKKEASMFQGIEGIQDGRWNTFLSCGNTGALMASSTLKLRTIEGIDRPSLASIIPTKTNRFILIDVGANPTHEAKILVHNAILGSHFAQAVLQLPHPRIGLLTIGTEEGKGDMPIQTAHTILKQCKNLSYTGLIEGFDVFQGTVDVVVCDGFVGNIILKTCESLFLQIQSFLKEKIQETCIRKLGAFFCQGAFQEMKKQLAPEKFSGAPLLGLNGWVFKAHGSSKAAAVAGAIQMMLACIEVYPIQTVKADIHQANALFEKLSSSSE